MKNIIKFFLNKIGYTIAKKKNLDFSIPIEADSYEIALINIAKKYSMTDFKNLYLSTQAMKYISKMNISGDIVECGVWKGGHLIIFKSLCDKYNLKKNIFAYDTYEGMTESSLFDLDYKNNNARDILSKTKIKNNDGDNIWCYAPLDNVKENIIKNCGNINNISFIKGNVVDTLKKKKPNKISILRLDTDFYESTKIELETLYPLLQKDGILIIDDYGHWKGARKAVDEFFANNYHFKHIINGTCRMIIKK